MNARSEAKMFALLDAIAGGVRNIESRLTELGGNMQAGLDRVESRLGRIETRVEVIETSLPRLESRISALE